MNPKQRAAEAAMTFVRDGMVVGIGTGSTADFFIVALGEALRSGKLKDIRGVSTSVQSERRAIELGVPLIPLSADAAPDVTVDGADEIDPQLNLIKGLGGALLREKIVAQNSRLMVVIADSGKSVPKLGAKSPLPVEVAAFAHEVHIPFFRGLNAEPTLRRDKAGSVYQTDNGNVIYDCRFPGGIDDPSEVEHALARRAGVVDCGLFLGIAGVALIADDQRVEERRGPLFAPSS
ncbi:MAG: ribose-5-phosphate isomerase RpiA [Tepidisphaeraceae bacterium]